MVQESLYIRNSLSNSIYARQLQATFNVKTSSNNLNTQFTLRMLIGLLSDLGIGHLIRYLQNKVHMRQHRVTHQSICIYYLK